jgi:RsmE family RNA methyltransferase
MNMLFLDTSEIGAPIPRSDERIKHILKVLKKVPGNELAAGTPDGMLGTARIEAYDGNAMSFSFTADREAPPLRPIILLLGFPRPIQANRILKDLASLGVGHIILSGTELGEKSYFQSDFFKNREFRAALIEGAEQAANPKLPVVDTAWSLGKALDKLDMLDEQESLDGRWAFDPYRAETAFGAVSLHGTAEQTSLALAIGSERGWTPAELDLLASRGFSFATLGDRILKTETAAITAVTIALSKLGYI